MSDGIRNMFMFFGTFFVCGFRDANLVTFFILLAIIIAIIDY